MPFDVCFCLISVVLLPANDVKLETPDCKCQLYSTCAWSKQLINQITVLEKTDPKRRAYSKQFRSQVCNTAHRDIWCCRDGEAATEEELKKLNHIDDLLSGIYNGVQSKPPFRPFMK